MSGLINDWRIVMNTWKCPKCGKTVKLVGKVETCVIPMFMIADDTPPCKCGIVYGSKTWRQAHRELKKQKRAK